MSWVKLDDGFVDHPKIAKVGAIGAWLQVQALCYCNRNLTDGFVPWGVARSFVARGAEYTDAEGRRWSFTVTCGMQGRDLDEIDWPAVLVEARIWELVPGGYQVHDYKDYQRPKAEVLATRDYLNTIRRDAGRRGGVRSGEARRSKREANAKQPTQQNESPVPVPVPLPEPGSVPKGKKPSRSLRSLDTGVRDNDAAFMAFFQAYPRHVKKQAAWEEWQKLGPAPPLERILAALQWQVQQPDWLKEGRRYVPEPSAYLHGRRWEDEPTQAPLLAETPKTSGNLAAMHAWLKSKEQR